MTVLTDHFVLLVWLAALVSAFLAILWKDDARARRVFFLRTFGALVAGSIAAGWLLALMPVKR